MTWNSFVVPSSLVARDRELLTRLDGVGDAEDVVLFAARESERFGVLAGLEDEAAGRPCRRDWSDGCARRIRR